MAGCLALLLAGAVSAPAQLRDPAAQEKYERTYNHAVEVGEDPMPEPVVQAHVNKRLNQNGAYSFYEATDITERPFIVKSREKLEVGQEYTLTGHVEPAKANPQVKKPVFVASEVAQESARWLWYVLGAAVVGGLVALWLIWPRIAIWFEKRKDENDLTMREKREQRNPTVMHGRFGSDSGVAIPQTALGLMVDPGFNSPTRLLEMGYDPAHQAAARDVIDERVTVYQISRPGGEPKEKTATDLPIHHQVQIEDPNKKMPVLSRGGSLVLLCSESGDTYIMASQGAKNPSRVIRANQGGSAQIAERAPVKLEEHDRVEMGHFTFTYRVGAEHGMR